VSDSTWSDAVWRKSSRSSGGTNCVEIAVREDKMAIRNSKDPGGPILVFPPEVWRAFIGWITAG